MTRAFVAIRPPDSVLDAVAELHFDAGRPTTRPQWHITLQFLGNKADVDAVGSALSGLTSPRGTARLRGLGAFPSARRARVVWLGLVEGAALLGAIAREVGERLAPLGHEPEARPFHPHLTLARLKQPADLRDRLAGSEAAAVGPSWPVDHVTLYESRLHRRGAEYLPLGEYPLAGP